MQEDTFKRRLLPRDWRDWALSALLRACAAFGFLLVPTVESRVGDAALALVCIAAGSAFAAVVGYRWYTTRQPLRVELIADGIALVVLVPALALAAGIQAADSRFGGRDENVHVAWFHSYREGGSDGLDMDLACEDHKGSTRIFGHFEIGITARYGDSTFLRAERGRDLAPFRQSDGASIRKYAGGNRRGRSHQFGSRRTIR